jgi:cytidylate kinase
MIRLAPVTNPTDPQHPLIGNVVTVDGPASSGKGTLAKRLAKHYRLKFLDTGCLYRATAWLVLEESGAPADPAVATAAARRLAAPGVFDFRHKGNNVFGVWIEGREVTAEIRTLKVGETASVVAVIAGVRAALLDLQKNFVAQWKDVYGVVLDGRDTGARIAPGARLKIFLTADPAVRARWRQAEAAAAGKDVPVAQVYEELKARDERDRPNTLQTADARVIDATALDQDGVEAAAVALVREAFGLA